MNKNFRKAMISTICLLVVGILSLTGVTYAWFTASQTAQVTGIEVSIASADGGVLLSTDGSDWSYTLSAEDDNSAVAVKVPVSTAKSTLANDTLSFFKGNIVDAEEPDVITTEADTEGNYFVDQFLMKNDNATVATVTVTPNVSASKPAVKNAVRYAIVDMDNDVVYIYAGNAANDTGSYYGVIKATAEAFNCKNEGANLEVVTLDSINALSITVNPVEYNDEGVEINNNARSFAIYAWMEGNDADCINALSGSNFGIELSFTTELADA